LTVNFLLKKLKSFFCYFRIGSILIRHLMTTTKMELELGPVKRTIIVKKRRPVAAAPAAAKTGIDRFDEYIQKSGLEPKSYQREGVEFCLRRESAASAATGITGGIIADEMGLGKTMMMMGLILANLAAFKRTLIVVPVALVAQWVAQIKRTIIDTGVKSDLVVFVFHGATAKRRVVLEQPSKQNGGGDECPVWCHRPPKNTAVRAIDIVITTYGCVAMEEPAAPTVPAATVPVVLSLLTFRANRVIFDEAHHLRNKASRVFKGAMRVVGVAGATHRPSVWCVTGTPIQNKISDLKSLCYVLGFRMCDVMSEEKRKQIRNEYVLRRTKVSVGMVVAATSTGAEGDVTCAPRLQSLEHYKSNVPWSSENELDLSREIHRSARNTTDRAERLKLFTRMRQMCVWPSLLRRAAGGDTADTADTADDARHGLSLDEYRVAVSKQSKMDRVVATMAAEAGVGRKSIVFCHYRREMTQLRDMLLRTVVGDSDVAIIDGTVSAKERARILAAEPTVLILQIRTCSEGLNLQSYSDVYFVSPHWNPCVEDQAIARCYRMGQTSQVRVFRFYMSDFVAERSGAADAEAGEAGAGAGEAGAGEAGDAECISTLDHKCEEIQERKRVLCNEFLCGV
jgi:non-specific serine/threonine protein kinase